MDQTAPIRSCAAEEGNIEIPLWAVPVALVTLYVCLFSGLGALGLVGPDEPRYAAIARAMAESHDWVTPRLWGTPWFEKPVLYYWTAGAAMRLFGVNEFAARLPSALAALLGVLAAAWAALRCYGVGAAWYALLMLPGTVAMIGFARSASPDALFAALLAATMAVAVEMLQKARPGTGSRIAFGFFLGAATLAKGPAAVALAGGATLLWAAFAHQWRAALRFLHPLVVAAFCATALPWYTLCAVRNPDFLRIFLWQHNLERYLTPVFQHRQPFWFFGPILLLAVLPWLPSFLGAVVQGVRRMRESPWTNSPGWFFACWAIFPLLFFSLSQSKLPGYILPAIPALFVPLGQITAAANAGGEEGRRWVMGATGLVFVVLPALAHRAIQRDASILLAQDLRFVAAAYLASLAGGILILGLCYHRRIRAGLYASVLVVAGLVGLSNLGIVPALDAQISTRPLASELLRLEPDGKSIAVYHLPRGWDYGLSFYLGREVQDWRPGTPAPDWLVTTTAAETGIIKHDPRSHWQALYVAGSPGVCLLRNLDANSSEMPAR